MPLPGMTEGRMADVVILTPGVLTGDLLAPAAPWVPRTAGSWSPPSPPSPR